MINVRIEARKISGDNSIMTEPFAYTETDRTKSKWLANVYQDFVKNIGRSNRALFYYALQRNVSDYPICGYFVGEIRVTRPYHEMDGEKLPKWNKKSSRAGIYPCPCHNGRNSM